MSTDERLYLIWSHEHRGWWRPGGWSYTPSAFEAGHWTETAAKKELGWASFRPWLEDGRPHEVLIEAPTEQMPDVDVLLLVRQRIEEATTRAIADRAQAVTR